MISELFLTKKALAPVASPLVRAVEHQSVVIAAPPSACFSTGKRSRSRKRVRRGVGSRTAPWRVSRRRPLAAIRRICPQSRLRRRGGFGPWEYAHFSDPATRPGEHSVGKPLALTTRCAGRRSPHRPGKEAEQFGRFLRRARLLGSIAAMGALLRTTKKQVKRMGQTWTLFRATGPTCRQSINVAVVEAAGLGQFFLGLQPRLDSTLGRQSAGGFRRELLSVADGGGRSCDRPGGQPSGARALQAPARCAPWGCHTAGDFGQP